MIRAGALALGLLLSCADQDAPNDVWGGADPIPEGMVWIPGGTFTMGGESPHAQPDEFPARRVTVSGFFMDVTEVTNARFLEFVEATGHVTTAELPPPIAGAAPGSVVFTGTARLEDGAGQWWAWVEGADWRHPEGPASSLKGRMDHPAVHVSWEDASAYAAWAEKRLPTEAEWEFASRGGLEGAPWTWGPEERPKGKWLANIWQGDFPTRDAKEDGFHGTAPVGSFPPNGWGLSDMAGNTWEWCADWYRPDAYSLTPTRVENPAGPHDSFDPAEPRVPKKVIRGGSWLCSDRYCTGYRPGARMKTSPDTGLNHTGFRCVKDG